MGVTCTERKPIVPNDPGAGATDGTASDENTSDSDEERYSRQVYTLGARAHGLVRSSCVIVDGPLESGLVWESLKNLVLSGIGRIVILTDGEQDSQDVDEEALSKADKAYHMADLDDLGKTYIQGARAEISQSTEGSMDTETTLDKLLVEFLIRLNPSLQVSTMSKQDFSSDENLSAIDNGKFVFLCLDRPYERQVFWNDKCRSAQDGSRCTSFVSAETAGVYGRVFCDFGPIHEVYDADGESPLVTPLDGIDKIEQAHNGSPGAATTFLVKCIEGERHDVSKNDIVVFQRSDGSHIDRIPFKVTKILTPQQVHVQVESETSFHDEDIIQQINTEASTFSRKKQIQEIHFVSLRDAAKQKDALITPCDLDKSFDETRRNAVFDSFQTLDTFVQQEGRMPRPSSDKAAFFELSTKKQHSDTEKAAMDLHYTNFLNTCRAKFVPLQAVFGAVAAQECLKAVSGLYNPTHQFLLYDCDEVLPSSIEPCDHPSMALSYIVGEETVKTFRNQRLFVVGSGAIGCEILKNLAAMGAGSWGEGRVIVTDMDTIEKSNLSRQLLFRDSDIGKFKSKAAQEAVQRFNPLVTLECHTSKVGDEEESGPFSSSFWSKGFDVILNALDNMEARLYMDGQCVANDKALVDAGTLGSKGNVQVVVPHQSESYGSSVDPPEPAIPVCTLKNFPYAISHTIQWGRDLFDGLFVRRPRQANKYAEYALQNDLDAFATKLDHDLGDQAALEAATEIAEDVFQMNEKELADDNAIKSRSIEWAVSLARHLFHKAIEDLLLEHPADSVDDDGEKFWSGSRKMPQKLRYVDSGSYESERQEEINRNMIDFVRSAARLRYETCTGAPSSPGDNLRLMTTDDVVGALESFPQVSVTIPSKEDCSPLPIQAQIKEKLVLLKSIEGSKSPSPAPLFVAEFEKDDDTNDHITFISAASNLRAICYGIPPVDAMETRKVAGKIVPAMITTTALVSALSCIELVKLCTAEMTLQRHRNAFINLALPFFAFTAPLPAEEYPGLRGSTHTMWDRITIKEGKKAAKAGGLTLKKVLRRVCKKAYKDDPDVVNVSNISFGSFMIYASFLHEDDDDLLNRSIWDVIEEAIVKGNEFDQEFARESLGAPDETKSVVDDPNPSFPSFVDLTVAVEDVETGDEVELPPVRLIRTYQ
ncbi:MAG: hypothetical protein SGILL_000233 [Bacillariaceae sp.]